MSKSVKGKGKDVKPVWTSLMDNILEAALIEHPHDYAGILRDPNYSDTFKGYNRESLRRKWRTKLDRDAKKAGAGTSVQNNNNAADMEDAATTLIYMANTADMDPTLEVNNNMEDQGQDPVDNIDPMLEVNINMEDQDQDQDPVDNIDPVLEALGTNNETLKTTNNLILQVLTKMDTMIELMKK